METNNQLNKNPQLEPRKNWFLRHQVLYSIIAALLLVVIIGFVLWWQTINSITGTTNSPEDITNSLTPTTSQNPNVNFKATIVDKIDFANSGASFIWSPTDSNTFAVLPNYSPRDIQVYKVENNKIIQAKQFTGNYSSIIWSKDGKHILAMKDYAKNQTFPITLVSLSIDNGSESELIKSINDYVEYNEVTPCTIMYNIQTNSDIIHSNTTNNLKGITVPNCVATNSYQAYIYVFHDPPADILGGYNIYKSESGKTTKIASQPPTLTSGHDFSLSVSPNGKYYWRDGNFYSIDGKKLSVWGSQIPGNWSLDGEYMLELDQVNQHCNDLLTCVLTVNFFHVLDGGKVSVSGLPELLNDGFTRGAEVSLENKYLLVNTSQEIFILALNQ